MPTKLISLGENLFIENIITIVRPTNKKSRLSKRDFLKMLPFYFL